MSKTERDRHKKCPRCQKKIKIEKTSCPYCKTDVAGCITKLAAGGRFIT